MFRKKTIAFLIFICVATVFAATTFASEREEFHEVYPIRSGVKIEIDNVNGLVDVRTWDRDEVEVHAVKKTSGDRDDLDRANIEVKTGDVMTIKTIHHRRDNDDDTFFKRFFRGLSFSGKGVSVDYTINIPESALLSRAKTTNGKINVVGTRGDAILRSTNGNVYAEDIVGTVDVHTTNGNIEIAGETVVTDARTTNGGIRATVPDEIDRDLTYRTTNGSITLSVSSDMDARVDLRTTNGSVRMDDFTITMESSSKRSITGSLGSGGSTIKASTTNGSVRLEKK